MASKLQACLRTNGTLQWRVSPPRPHTPGFSQSPPHCGPSGSWGWLTPCRCCCRCSFRVAFTTLPLFFFIKLVSIQHILILFLLPQILPDHSTSVPASCPFPLFLLLPGQQKGAVRCHGVCPHTPGQSPGLGPLSNTKQTHSFCFLFCLVSLFGC